MKQRRCMGVCRWISVNSLPRH